MNPVFNDQQCEPLLDRSKMKSPTESEGWSPLIQWGVTQLRGNLQMHDSSTKYVLQFNGTLNITSFKQPATSPEALRIRRVEWLIGELQECLELSDSELIKIRNMSARAIEQFFEIVEICDQKLRS